MKTLKARRLKNLTSLIALKGKFMALEVKLLKLYHTPKGKLRAQVSYAGKTHTLKCDRLKSGKSSVSLVSMPLGFTSFEVAGISKDMIDNSVTLRLSPAKELVRVDFITSQFI